MAADHLHEPVETPLVFPGLALFHRRSEQIGYASMRAWFGLTLLTHGYPKLLHLPHSGSDDAFANLVDILGGRMHLPAAWLIAMLVTLVETLGAVMLIVGFATRIVAAAMAVELLVVAFGVHWPMWEWTEKGMEYPLLMAAIAGYMAVRGGGRFAVDHRLGQTI